VLITAATDSNQPVELAGKISRVKGRVVIVGMTGLDIPRQPFYMRELSLTISMSYGPGRYDPDYEERGNDYPFGYVRWTENRNIEAFLGLIGSGSIKLNKLISHRFPIDHAERAYQLLSGESSEPYLGVVLNYDPDSQLKSRVALQSSRVRSDSAINLGVIGAGGYVPAMLLPHFKAAEVNFKSIATASGVSAHDVGKRFGFQYAVSNAEEVLSDAQINLIIVGTRHDLHAELATKSLLANKHVLVEKPLALDDEELEKVITAASTSSALLMVGFNRRFSPLALQAKNFFAGRRVPLSISYRVNAGRLPKEHWLQDERQGGGRIIGEVCHFIDLLTFLAGAKPISVFAEAISAKSDKIVDADSVFITLKFEDGSNGTIAYLAEGDRLLAKERVEIFGEGKSLVLDDYRSVTMYRDGREKQVNLKAQDKGQKDQVTAVCAAVLSGEAPISLDDLASTSRATFRILDSLRERARIEL
jgi:polar amino acid transport system substrate-binding protein